MPRYGDKTSKALDDYLKEYKLPTGTTRSGLVAPFKDLQRNYKIMKTMNLDPSDHFFHCKANYEAASRGRYGAAVAAGAGYLRELADTIIKRDSISAARSDLRANARGRAGAIAGKSLKATCPTHHTKYK